MALYDPFGVDVPLNFDITHSLIIHVTLASDIIAVHKSVQSVVMPIVDYILVCFRFDNNKTLNYVPDFWHNTQAYFNGENNFMKSSIASSSSK